MAKYNSLLPPYIPQMNDGVINSEDLIPENKIYVEIGKYQHANIADEVIIKFGYISTRIKIISDPNDDFPIQVDFDASLIPDGIYMVNYSVTDFAGNTSQSPLVFAILDRLDSRKLPPPKFIDADGNNIINNNSVIANMGTHLFIPPYRGISIGDSVIISFWMIDNETSQVIPGSSYTINNNVDASMLIGFTILIPESNILLVNSARGKARYQVSSDDTPTETSNIASVFIELNHNATLPGPVFIDNIDGWITSAQLFNGIREQCEYNGMQLYDLITLYIQGYSMNNTPIEGTSAFLTKTVSLSDLDNGYVLFSFLKEIAEKVKLGYLTSYYKVEREGESYYSYNSNVKVDLIHRDKLPPPEFTQNIGGVININDINISNGAIIKTSYSNMKINDTVTIHSYSTDNNDIIINNSTYQDVAILSSNDIAQGAHNFLCPKNKVILTPVDGKLHAYYTVHYPQEEGISFSEIASVYIDGALSSELKAIITTNAAPHDYNTIHVSPCNYAKIEGKPGVSLSLSGSNGIEFVESGAATHSLVLDENGVGRFRIQAMQSGTGIINVFQTNNPVNSLTMTTTFGNYILGEGNIKFYNYSTGASNDGLMPCCIYLKTNAITGFNRISITKVRVLVDGSALIVGYDNNLYQSAIIELNDDKSCEIQIVNKVKENVNVTITLPESSGTILRLMISFQ